jgi:hypothetical protein
MNEKNGWFVVKIGMDDHDDEACFVGMNQYLQWCHTSVEYSRDWSWDQAPYLPLQMMFKHEADALAFQLAFSENVYVGPQLKDEMVDDLWWEDEVFEVED